MSRLRDPVKKRPSRKKTRPEPHHLPAGRVQKVRHPLMTMAILFGSIFVLVSGMWVLSSSGVVASRFKPEFESELSKALNRDVTVGKLEGGLFDRVVLRDINLSTRKTHPESLDMTIQRVVVQYSLWDILIRKKPLAESLHHIQLIRPMIRIEKSPDGKWRGPHLASDPSLAMTAGPAVPTAVDLPKIRVTLVSGEVKFSDGIHTTSIKNLKGLLNLRDPGAARLFLSGRSDRLRRQNIKISGLMDLTTSTLKVGLKADRVDLAALDTVVRISDYFSIQKGQADLELKIRSHDPQPQDLIPGFSIEGKMVLYDATVKSSLLDDPLQSIFGVAHLKDRDITLKSMQAVLAGAPWQARGEIQNLQNPILNIRVQSDVLELSDLAARLPNLSSLGAEGSGKAAILIKGKAPDLTVTANFRMPKGKIGRLQIRKFEIITRYRDRELRLMLARGIFAQGWIEGRGRILFPLEGKDPPHLSFRGDAKDLEMREIAGLFGAEEVHGKVEGMLTIEGPLNKPTLYGKVMSPRIHVSGTQFDAIKGQIESNGDAVKMDLTTNWGVLTSAKFDIEARREKLGWLLNRFRVTQKKRELLRADGTWNLDGQDKIHGKLLASQLPIQLIPLMPPGTKHLNGSIDFQGTISGTMGLPLLQGKFSTEKLLSFPGGKMDARGGIQVSPKKIELADVWIDRQRIGMQGHFTFGQMSALLADVEMRNFPVQHLLALAGVKDIAKAGGDISGKIGIDGPTAQLKCKGDIRFRKPAWGDIRADNGVLKFSTNGRRVWVKEMELVQPTGKFNGVFETELGRMDGPFQILTWMDGFHIDGRTYTGELKIKGQAKGSAADPEYVAQMTLDNFEIDRKSFPQAKGEVSLKGDQVAVRTLSWGDDLFFSGDLAFGKQMSGKCQLVFNDSRLKPIRALLAPDMGLLSENVSGALNIQLKEKNLEANLRVHSGKGELQGELESKLGEKQLERFLGRLQIQNWHTPLLFDLFMLAKPIDAPQGSLSGRLVFDGEGGQLDRLDGDLDFSDFVYGKWEFLKLKLIGEKRGALWTLKQLEGTQARGSLSSERGSMRSKPDGSYDISMNLLADNFGFFSRKYHGHFGVNGSLVLKPSYDLQLAVISSDFQLDLYPFGNFNASVRYWDDKIAIRTPPEARVKIMGDLALPPGGAVVFDRLTISDPVQKYIETQGKVDVDGTSDLFIKVKNMKADMLARCLGWPQPWTGTVNGTFRYTDPEQISHFDIQVKIENGSVLDLPFDVFHGNIVIDHDWLYFRGPEGHAVLKRHGYYTMDLSGKMPMPQSDEAEERLKGAEMDVKVSMPEGDFSYITFIPHFSKGSGKSTLELNVKGTLDYPTLYGRATVTNGTLYPRIYAPKIEHLNADIEFDDNRVYVKQLDGMVGGGRLEIAAGKRADWACIFRRLQPHELNLKLTTPDGPIKTDNTPDYEFMSAKVSADAGISGTFEAPILSGKFELSDGQFRFPPQSLTEFAKKLKTSNMSYERFKIVSKNNLWFYNDVVRALIKQDQSVVFNGGQHDFAGDGRVAIERGSFTYLETDFSLSTNEETVVDFQNQEKPQLNGLAETTIRNVNIKDEGRSRDATIYLQVRGTVGALKIKLYSEPEMTQAQIVSLLTLGEDYSNWSQEEIDQKVQTAGARVLGRLAGNLIGREIEKSIKRITPLDVIDIRLGGVEKLADSIMTGSGNTGNAQSGSNEDITGTSLLDETQIDVGKYLTNDLFLNYRGTLKDKGVERGGLSWESSVGLEYNLDSSRKIKIYKNFDEDSDQELFWGIEGRVQFEGWSPDQEAKENQKNEEIQATPTPNLQKK